MAPGIAGLELEATGKAVVCSHSQSIVVGVGDVLRIRHHPEAAVRYCGRQIRERRRAESIQGGIRDFFMRTVVANIHGA